MRREILGISTEEATDGLKVEERTLKSRLRGIFTRPFF